MSTVPSSGVSPRPSRALGCRSWGGVSAPPLHAVRSAPLSPDAERCMHGRQLVVPLSREAVAALQREFGGDCQFLDSLHPCATCTVRCNRPWSHT